MEEAKQSYVVVGIGEALWDIYRHGRHLGGTPANVVIHACQLGEHGVLVSRVGSDVMGRELLTGLSRRQVPVRYVQVDDVHITGNVMISLDVKGVPSFRCSHDVAFDYLRHDDQHPALAASADAVLFSTLGLRSAVARQAIYQFLRAAQRALKIVDVNTLPLPDEFRSRILESLAFADVFKTNIADLQALRIALHREKETIRRFAEYLIKKYSLKLVAVTLGESGCELFDGARTVKVPGLPVRVIDTTGAGDAFSAGMIYKYLRGAALEEIAEFANLLGAYVSTNAGATPVFSPASVEAFKEALT